MTATDDEITLHVCVTCRAGRELDASGTPEGLYLHRALEAAGGKIRLRAVECLASCERGCAAVLEAPGRWTYLLGRLDRSLAPDLLDYAAAYARAARGTVMPSKRPASLAAVVLGRVPGAGMAA